MDVSPAPADEERLEPSDVTFRLMAEAMPQLVWAARPDGRRDYFNERWYAFTGMPRSGEVDWRDYLHGDDAAGVEAAWARALERGELYEVELRLKEAATGAYRWFLERAAPLRDEAGEIVRWIGTDTDVDEAKRAEGAAAVLARAGELPRERHLRGVAVLHRDAARA